MMATEAGVIGSALEQIGSVEGELTVDLTGVRRVDAGALRQLEQLAAAARERSAEVVLRGVDVDVYKVLKLVKLASRFRFTE